MEKKGFLGFIETVGNKLPHPLLLFVYITIFTVLTSFIASLFNVHVTSPVTQENIYVKNLLTFETLVDLCVDFVANFQKFPVLGVVILLAVASGFAEKIGFFRTLIEMFLKNAKGNTVVYVAAFIGVLGNSFGDSAFLIIPLVLATVFKGVGRNPIAGIILGYATVGGGYGASIVPGGWDVILTPITIEAASFVDPYFSMNYISGYYYVSAMTFAITIVSAYVTIKYIEPRLGKYEESNQGEIDAKTLSEVAYTSEDDVLTDEKVHAAKIALWGLVIFLIALIISCIPESSPFRSDKGSLIYGAPLMSSMQTLIILCFFIPAYIYAKLTKQVTNIKDLANILSEAVKNVAPFIVLAIIISQFLVLFADSNLGVVMAVTGGDFLKASPLPTGLIIILFMLLIAFSNIFIVSGSAKYLIFGPVFVPMLMQLDIHPAFTQVLYRMGDSMTNHLSPLNAFFIILLMLVQKYDKNIGIGTIFSLMIPYVIAYTITIILFSLVWFYLDIPPGVGSSVLLDLPLNYPSP